MKAPYGTTVVSFAVFMTLAGLSGCAGEVPTTTDGSVSSTGSSRQAEGATQTPDVPLPDSASPIPCKGYPGFDRGCPESAK
jgi:hypothetical protein